jgi:hypothetical protein
MANDTTEPRPSVFRIRAGEFWSGDLGLTLILISLALLVFVITPMRESGVPGRLVVEVIITGLMVFGALAAKQSRIGTVVVISFIVATAVLLGVGRLRPDPLLREVGSICSTIALLLYVRIVLLVMLRGGRVTWSRIQGGVAAYLLIGMAWASAYQVVEQFWPGSIRFEVAPRDLDQLIAKLTYFSFCTLTTIGGEISPVTPIARSLRIAEAAVGQLLPSILIGTLVAMAMQSRANS